MPIISLSVNDKLLADVSAFAKKSKLGKSEFARAALSQYIDSHYKQLIDASKTYVLSLSVICSESHKHDVHQILHDATVRSQFHMCLDRKRCIEVFGIESTGKKLLAILSRLELLPKVEKIQLCLDR